MIHYLLNNQWKRIIPILCLILGWLPGEAVMSTEILQDHAVKDNWERIRDRIDRIGDRISKPIPGETHMPMIAIKGRLTDDGVECQALRPFNREDELYTLIGDLQGFKTKDAVMVVGKIADFSICQQGITLEVVHINWFEPFGFGEKCGNTRCPRGEFCCNESCGICTTTPNTQCPTFAPCDPLPTPCDR